MGSSSNEAVHLSDKDLDIEKLQLSQNSKKQTSP